MMKKSLKKHAALLLAALLMFTAVPVAPAAQAAYTAPADILRIGLYTLNADGSPNTKSFPSANLQNVTGYGYGYEFGYYDSSRDFWTLGAYITDTNQITMMMDRNMTYNASGNSYTEGTGGPVVVGCFHIRLDGAYSDYAAARDAADSFPYEDAFVRYENGAFYVLVGEYAGAAAAAAAASAYGISGGYTIDSGTAYTVTVVATGTNRILFEFDCGTTYSLAVRPRSENGEKTRTYFKGEMYYGDFVYWRNTGGNLTVINYVEVEDYIKGVVPYEMSPSWPVEALKAQAISARTYAMYNLNKHRLLGFDICNSTECQAYHGTRSATEVTDAVVEETAGQYLTYQGKLCDIYYYSSNGGASENVENVWTASYPYLRGVRDPYEANIAGSVSSYNWSVTYTGAQLASKLGHNLSTIVKVDIAFTAMGNVYSITFTDVNGRTLTASKESARTILGFRSQRYTVNGQVGGGASGDIYVNSSGGLLGGSLEGVYAVGGSGTDKLPSGDVYAISGAGTVSKVQGNTTTTGSSSASTFVFTGSGYGHNVGMSQWGAYSMAKYYGLTCKDILTFYYSGTEVVTSR